VITVYNIVQASQFNSLPTRNTPIDRHPPPPPPTPTHASRMTTAPPLLLLLFIAMSHGEAWSGVAIVSPG